MTDRSITQTQDEPIDDSRTRAQSDADGYDLPIDLYAGTIIAIMGLLVLITPLVAEMPSDAPWNPMAMNLISGAIYVVVALALLVRADIF
ncbi:hypothetical protein [Natronorubrum halophilum]|uniref:hypothetical protein n=1 Tax=Natronorubrum halophilum TaxID=1702106 RepID=UPI000EF6B88A|nr:hypothetical protein [Natronorubrum halophilum]